MQIITGIVFQIITLIFIYNYINTTGCTDSYIHRSHSKKRHLFLEFSINSLIGIICMNEHCSKVC